MVVVPTLADKISIPEKLILLSLIEAVARASRQPKGEFGEGMVLLVREKGV